MGTKSASAACVFQFTPLREGRQKLLRILGIETEFQFTPLREGRRFGFIVGTIAYIISIHAPPRGATPAWERKRRVPRDFNSRPSARGDAQGFCALRINFISIHAPPRGATFARQNVGDCIRVFQFTPLREGRRTREQDEHDPRPTFQFTPLREGRPCPLCSTTASAFQFTPLREGRPSFSWITPCS